MVFSVSILNFSISCLVLESVLGRLGQDSSQNIRKYKNFFFTLELTKRKINFSYIYLYFISPSQSISIFFFSEDYKKFFLG